MGVAFDTTHVWINGVEVNTFSAADRFTRTTVWSPATIRWGTTDSLEPVTASTLSLRVTVPPGDPVPKWGQWIEIQTEGVGVFSGRIDGAEREQVTLTDPRDGTEYDVTSVELTASDELATLGRIRLADQPWPEEGHLERVRRIEALLADRGVAVNIGTAGGVDMRARDVDAFPALDALTRSMAHTTAVLACDGREVQDFYPPQPAILYYDPDAGGLAWVDHDQYLPLIEAGCLESGRRVLDTGSVVASVTVEHPEHDPDDPSGYVDRRTTIKRQSTENEYGPGGLRVTSDAIGDLTPLWDRAERILTARNTADWRIPSPVRVLLDQWSTGRTAALHMIWDKWRPGRPFRLLNGPDDLDPYHRVVGGELSLHGDTAQTELALYTEPAANYAGESVSIATPSVEIPLSALAEITFADARTIGRASIGTK